MNAECIVNASSLLIFWNFDDDYDVLTLFSKKFTSHYGKYMLKIMIIIIIIIKKKTMHESGKLLWL